MKSTIAIIIAAIIVAVGTAGAITVTYSGNVPVVINGVYYDGGTITITPPPEVSEPVIETPVIEEPVYDYEVTYAGPDIGGNGHPVYRVEYVDGPIVYIYGYDDSGRVSMTGYNMPPFGTYYEQAIAMYNAYIA